MFVTGLLLAADSSPHLGVPRQLLAYHGDTLLGATLDVARTCGFDQLIVTLGSAADQIRDRVDLDGVRVVDSPHADTGSSSIVPALDAVDRRTDGIVVMLGDQPGVTSATVWSLVAEVAGPATPIGVCRYDDGHGHPCWFGRELFGQLRQLRSDDDLWDLIEGGRYPHPGRCHRQHSGAGRDLGRLPPPGLRPHAGPRRVHSRRLRGRPDRRRAPRPTPHASPPPPSYRVLTPT